MKKCKSSESANILITTLSVIFILSMVGANVLINCTTRYNVTAKQVKAWKTALVAAEAGGDVAFNTIRKAVNSASPATVFANDGWATASPAPSWTKSVAAFGENNSMTASVTVDTLPAPNISPADTNYYYRIRSTGVARVFGLKRTGMDDRMDASTKGDSLLRKIDFNYDHYIAAYGPNGDGVGAQITPVPNPQISRRVELITVPIRQFEVAIKASGTFYGMGSAAYIDSFRSSNGAYSSSVKTNANSPYYGDSRSGSVEINAGTATIMGSIYGNVYTNNGTVTGKTTNVVSPGVIDNSVAFTADPYSMPSTAGWDTAVADTGNYSSSASGNVTFTPKATGSETAPIYYILNSFSNNVNLTVNPATGAGAAKTYVAILVNDDLGTSNGNGPSYNVSGNVQVKIYFTGNFNTKANAVSNTTGYSGNLQFLNVSSTPTSININSPGDFSAVFYAPNSDMNLNGNPDVTGSVVVHNFYSNGNVGWHYDRDLYSEGTPVDYRVASYVEDVR